MVGDETGKNGKRRWEIRIWELGCGEWRGNWEMEVKKVKELGGVGGNQQELGNGEGCGRNWDQKLGDWDQHQELGSGTGIWDQELGNSTGNSTPEVPPSRGKSRKKLQGWNFPAWDEKEIPGEFLAPLMSAP